MDPGKYAAALRVTAQSGELGSGRGRETDRFQHLPHTQIFEMQAGTSLLTTNEKHKFFTALRVRQSLALPLCFPALFPTSVSLTPPRIGHENSPTMWGFAFDQFSAASARRMPPRTVVAGRPIAAAKSFLVAPLCAAA